MIKVHKPDKKKVSLQKLNTVCKTSCLGEKDVFKEFDEWIKVTGVMDKNCSWYYECKSVIRDILDKQNKDLVAELRSRNSYRKNEHYEDMFIDRGWTECVDELEKLLKCSETKVSGTQKPKRFLVEKKK
jgi:hypothetical protein